MLLVSNGCLCVAARTLTQTRGQRTSVRPSTACTCAWLSWRLYSVHSVDRHAKTLCSLFMDVILEFFVTRSRHGDELCFVVDVFTVHLLSHTVDHVANLEYFG